MPGVPHDFHRRYVIMEKCLMLRCRASTVYKLTQLLHGEGLTHSNAIVLRFILRQMVYGRDHPASAAISANQIARSVRLSRSTIIHSFRRLRETGLIEIEIDPEWQRHKSSTITVASFLLTPRRSRTSVKEERVVGRKPVVPALNTVHFGVASKRNAGDTGWHG